MGRRLKSRIIIALIGLSAGWTTASAQNILTLNTADSAPYSREDDSGFYDVLLRSMFADQNVSIKINHLSSARSINNVNDGIDAGEYARTKGLQSRFKNLVMLDEKLVDFSFTVFSKDPDFSVDNGWNSFEKYNVAYINGWRILEKNVGKTKSLLTVSNQKELFALLAGGRVDLVIYEKWRGIHYLKQAGITGIFAATPALATRGMYLYLNKSYQHLIPGLKKSLRKLKQSGRYDEILAQTLGQK